MACGPARDTITTEDGDELPVGSVADGELLGRSGDEVVGVDPSSLGGSTIAAGTMMAWAANSGGGTPTPATAPSGWLICAGAAVSRSTYAALFAAIGTAFGAGDGSTTFNVPDMSDRFIKGWKTPEAVGATGGSTTPSVSVTDPGHSHTVGQATDHRNGGASVADNASPTGNSMTGISASIADGRPPFIALPWIIKT
jgi:microcystin-dependent protein